MQFLGITVPQQRTIAKKFFSLPLSQIKTLIFSNFHEERLTGLFILVGQYQKSKEPLQKKKIIDFYLNHLDAINNWDLVDSTAYKLLGNYLLDKPRAILYEMVQDSNFWVQRISMIATFELIRHHQFNDTIKLAKLLLNHPHDLLHKATGWMLREVGKRDIQILIAFLNQNTPNMPRTMLRYAIEKLPQDQRHYYLTLPKT